MPKVFDLDALILTETQVPFTFTFGGETFTVSAHYDPRVFRRAEQGDIAGALVMMLGQDQFDRLDKIDKPFDERHIKAIFDAWADHYVTTPGEVSASSRSSKSTGRQSKPTSNGSTDSPSDSSSPE